MAEAERWAKWQLLLKDKRRAYEKAQRRTKSELKAALDAGGSVWIFGTGPFGEFTAPPPKTLTQGEHEFANYDLVKVSQLAEDQDTDLCMSGGLEGREVGGVGNNHHDWNYIASTFLASAWVGEIGEGVPWVRPVHVWCTRV